MTGRMEDHPEGVIDAFYDAIEDFDLSNLQGTQRATILLHIVSAADDGEAGSMLDEAMLMMRESIASHLIYPASH